MAEIYRIIREKSKGERGCLLLASPTGSGKTHEACMAMADKLREADKRILLYLTPRVKNLDDVEAGIQKHLGEDGHLFSKLVKLESYRRSILKKRALLDLPLIRRWKETKELVFQIDTLPTGAQRAKAEARLFEGGKNEESEFRKRLRKEFRLAYLAAKGESDLTAKDFMKESEWSFIAELYPASLIDEKTVFLMTTQKFLTQLDTIIGSKFRFTDESFIAGAIVLMDEVDATKGELLSNVLRKQQEQDILDLFDGIQKCFQNLEEGDSLILKQYQDKLQKMTAGYEILKEMYFPNKKIVRYLGSEGETSNLNHKILNYRGQHTFYDKSYNYQYHAYREEEQEEPREQYNKILLASKENTSDPYITKMLNEISIFVNYCFRQFFFITSDYMGVFNKQITKVERQLLEDRNGITTVLHKIGFGRKESEFLAPYLELVSSYRGYQRKDKSFGEIPEIRDSIYYKGIYYTSVIEKEKFRESHILQNYSLQYTPELFMLDLASKARVIGLSATANFKGLHNFNIDFLKESLELEEINSEFVELTAEEKRRLREDYEEKTKGYSEIETIVEKVDCRDFPESQTLSEVLEYLGEGRSEEGESQESLKFFRKTKMKLEEVLLKTQGDSKQISGLYDYRRLQKICLYLKKMFQAYREEGILRNGLVFTNKLLSNWEDEIFSWDYLVLGGSYAYASVFGCNLTEAKEELEAMLFPIQASDLKEIPEEERNGEKQLFEKLRERVVKDQLVFLLSSYSSIGRGNNLQVPVGEEYIAKKVKEKEVFAINDWEEQESLDWDSLYLETPTNVLPNLTTLQNSKDEEIYKARLSCAYAIEELLARGECSYYQKKKAFAEFFDAIHGRKIYGEYYHQFYSCESIRLDYSSRLCQTIGRMARSNMKKHKNAIFYDAELLGRMSFLEGEDLLLTHEFEAFLKSTKEEIKQEREDWLEEVDEVNTEKNRDLQEFLEAFIKLRPWTEKERDFWEDLRLFTLRHPCIWLSEIAVFDEALYARIQGEKRLNNILALYDFSYGNLYRFHDKPKYKAFYATKRKYDERAEEDVAAEEVYISSKFKHTLRDFPHELSIEESRLQAILYAGGETEKENGFFPVLEYWREQGYAEKWVYPDTNRKRKEKYGLMLPTCYTNLYKGAIGEEAFMALMQYAQIPCTKVKSLKHAEFFDFELLVEGKLVYVDVKHFSEVSMEKDIGNIILGRNIVDKKKRTGADFVFVINMIDEKGSRRKQEVDSIYVIPGLFHMTSMEKCSFTEEKRMGANGEELKFSILEILRERWIALKEEK